MLVNLFESGCEKCECVCQMMKLHWALIKMRDKIEITNLPSDDTTKSFIF
jgi:hypothetical protein